MTDDFRRFRPREAYEAILAAASWTTDGMARKRIAATRMLRVLPHANVDDLAALEIPAYKEAAILEELLTSTEEMESLGETDSIITDEDVNEAIDADIAQLSED